MPRTILALLASVWASMAGALHAQTIDFKKADGDLPSTFTVSGLPAEQAARLAKLPAADPAWTREFAVYVRDTAKLTSEPARPEDKLPPIAGAYTLEKDRLTFAPSFPLRPGVTYQAVLAAPAGKPITREFSLPKPAATPAARVTQVYPSAEVLPENQLRFYLHFSAPMSRGEAYDHLRIIDENNKAAELPILELGEELWDQSAQRLTILIDPGRIKRGVKPREDIGTVFKSGHKYTLSISKEWHDAQGQPLAADFHKPFRVSPPVDAQIEPKEWKLEPPAIGTREPLVVGFPRPLDHALLERKLSVSAPGGGPLAGKVTVGAGEQRWEFRPDQPWPAGKLDLVVEPTLEDLAGNRIGRPFEVIGGDQPTSGLPEPYRLPLVLKPAK